MPSKKAPANSAGTGTTRQQARQAERRAARSDRAAVDAMTSEGLAGIDAVAATHDPYAATVWGSDSELGGLTDLEVPSGQLCLVKRPGVQGLIEAGILHDLDTLTSIVESKHIRRVKGAKGKPDSDEIDINSVMKDQKNLMNILHLTDRVVCYVVVRPEIKMKPDNITNRQNSVIYTDMIDINDKMFILNFAVGGSREIERFRGETGLSMGSMDNVQDLSETAE